MLRLLEHELELSARPIGVAVAAADPVRHAALCAMVAAAGHRVVADDQGDVLLSDRAVASDMPLLVVGESDDPAAGILPGSIRIEQLAAALEATRVGLAVRLAGPVRRVDFGLTARETDILRCLADGLSNKAVARRLAISQHTVKFHVEAVFAKLAVTSRAEAVAKALRTRLIEF